MTSDEFTEQLDENLRKWFKEKWVRFGPDGKIRGACARGDDSEGKPKCLPQKKAHALGKKGRKYAAAKKRREDPNPERRGKAKNVATKKKSNEEIQVNEKWSQKYKDSINCSNPKGFSQKAHCAGKKKNEDMTTEAKKCPHCGGPLYPESMINEKKDACYHKVRSRYKVWPSAYASGALVQCRKKGASNWGTGGKKKNESNIMKGLVDEGVIIGHDAKDPDVAVLGGAGSYKLSNLKKKAQMEANELAKDISEGKFKNSAYNVKQLANTLNTIVAAEKEMEKLYFGEDILDKFKKKPTRDKQAEMRSRIAAMSDAELRYEIADYKQRLPTAVAQGSLVSGAVNDYINALEIERDKRAYEKLKPDYPNSGLEEDYTGEFAAEKTPAINPYGGLKDKQHRGAISETPTDNPTGASGEGGWRKYKPKSAGITESYPSNIKQYARDLAREMREEEYDWEPVDLSDPEEAIYDAREQLSMFASSNMCDFFGDYDSEEQLQLIKLFNKKFGGVKEDTAYAGGGGQGGNAGESYRKFKPKSAGTLKEGTDELKSFLEKYPEAKDAMRNAVRHFEYAYDAMDHVAGHVLHKMPYSEWEKVRQDLIDYFVKYGLKADVNEEQLDEKCWDTHKQVGMKKKGDKMVPNCVPKESAIMKGIKR